MTKKSRIVGVRCPGHLLRQLDLAAEATGLSRSTVLKEAIARFCDVLETDDKVAPLSLTMEELLATRPAQLRKSIGPPEE